MATVPRITAERAIQLVLRLAVIWGLLLMPVYPRGADANSVQAATASDAGRGGAGSSDSW